MHMLAQVHMHTQMCACAHIHKNENTLIGGNSRQAAFTAKRVNLCCSPQGLMTAFGLVEAGVHLHIPEGFTPLSQGGLLGQTQRWALNGCLKMAQGILTWNLQLSSPQQSEKFRSVGQPCEICKTGVAFVFWELH